MTVGFSKNKHLRIFTHYSPELHPVFFLCVTKEKINKKKALNVSGSKCSFEQKESERVEVAEPATVIFSFSLFPRHHFQTLIYKLGV